ncbi:FBA and/or F-box-like domain containing protein [Asbolus verrucosus]|uniref:FBA and/or F-box-like domain containing protein n=1 Tax=Asbolus verrucosus TaxID=1661398 RepID=A0A482VRK1_ASBVE|nr:FBA and/or F-box-like domain containing protein [Asbolus verrucosus]
MENSETLNSKETQKVKNLESVETFKFHDSFIEDTSNGLYFNNFYLPEEVVLIILSYIDPKEVLKASLVCKKWCNLIKSDPFWFAIYSRVHKKKPKKLPWYVYYCLFASNYFDQNLIKNGNGQDKYEHWRIVQNGGDGFAIEDSPIGADPLSLDIPEFNGRTSCFATSYFECNKLQEISLESSPLMQLILNKFKPHIYLSEWVAGRFDCGCNYILHCKLYGKKLPNQLPSPPPLGRVLHFRRPNAANRLPLQIINNRDYVEHFGTTSEEALHVQSNGTKIEQWVGSTWSKVIELLVKDYPEGVKSIVFQHQGCDTQFWRGHYGSKMAGGVLKILFDSIEPCT